MYYYAWQALEHVFINFMTIHCNIFDAVPTDGRYVYTYNSDYIHNERLHDHILWHVIILLCLCYALNVFQMYVHIYVFSHIQIFAVTTFIKGL